MKSATNELDDLICRVSVLTDEEKQNWKNYLAYTRRFKRKNVVDDLNHYPMKKT